MHPLERTLLVDQIRRHGRCSVRVGGYCMSPDIPHGSTIEVTRQPRPSPGDVVAYFVGDQLFVHRVSNVNDKGILAAADAGRPAVHEVSHQECLGIVTSVQPPSLLVRTAHSLVRLMRRAEARVRGIAGFAPPHHADRSPCA